MNRTHAITRTAVLVVLAVLLVVAVGLAVLLPSTAQAYKSALDYSSATKIDEIFNDSTGFDQVNLQKLINAVAGSSTNITVEKLQSTVDSSSTTVGATGSAKTYSDTMRIADKNLIVTLGGIDWIPVFVSLADSDLVQSQGTTGSKPNAKDVVLTLWEATGTENATWCDTTDSTYGTTSNSTDGNYPANMYGTSKIRSVTLNNGGGYATSLNGNLTSYSQTSSSPYAKFTMNKASGGSDLVDYLVAPRYLSWQKEQLIPSGWNWAEQGKAFNNQHWGTMGKNSYASNNYPYYEDKANYDAWKDDLIWIPSCAEVGHEFQTRENSGIWFTSKTQRSASDIVWLRTAGAGNYYLAYGLTADGVHCWSVASVSHLVRPALHLNLTAAAKEAALDKPTGENNNVSKIVVYNGQEQSLNLGLATELKTSGKVNVSAVSSTNNGTGATKDSEGKQTLTATEVGTYTVTVTLADGYHWKNTAPDTDFHAETVTFTLTIVKRNVSIEVSIPQGQDTVSYGTSFNLQSSNNYNTYYKYKSGTIDLTSESDTAYSSSNFYQILASDLSQIRAITPTTNGSGAVGVGKYPLYLDLGTLASSNNYNITVTGDYSSSGAASGYSEYYGKAATVTVTPKSIDVTIENATHQYGSSPAELSISDPSQGWVKTEDKQTLLAAAGLVLKKKTAPNEQVTLNSVLPAGTYDITAESKQYGNYDVTFTSGTYTVTQANLTVTAKDTTITYGDAAPTNIQVEYSGWVNGEGSNVLTGTLSFNYGGYQAGSNATTYTVTPQGLESNNYHIDFVAGNLIVKPKDIKVQIEDANHVYGQAPVTPTVSNTLLSGAWYGSDNITSLGTITFTLTDNTLSSTLAVGNYTITAESKQYGNYNVTFTNGNYEVKKATIDAEATKTLPAASFNYASGAKTIQRHEIKVSASDFTTVHNMAVNITYGNITKVGGGLLVNGNDYEFAGGIYKVWKLGTYTVTVTVTADNHEDFTQEVTLTVNPTALSVRLSGSEITKTYGESIGIVNDLLFGNNGLRVIVTGFNGDTDELTNVLRFTVNGQANVIDRLNAGSYSFAVTSQVDGFTIDGNDTFANLLQIAKAKPNVEPIYTNIDKIFTSGTLPELDYVATSNGNVNGSIKWDDPALVVGTNSYSWTWTPDDERNYESVTGSVEFTVEAVGVDEFTVAFNPQGNKFYTSNVLNDLKPYLTVHVKFSDHLERDLDPGEYRLEGTLSVGNVRITVVYIADPSQTATFTVEVSAQQQQQPDDPNNPDDPVDPNPDDPNNPGNGGNGSGGNDEPSLWDDVKDWFEGVDDWFEQQALPFGYTAATLGLELFLIIILAIAARKPKSK